MSLCCCWCWLLLSSILVVLCVDKQPSKMQPINTNCRYVCNNLPTAWNHPTILPFGCCSSLAGLNGTVMWLNAFSLGKSYSVVFVNNSMYGLLLVNGDNPFHFCFSFMRICEKKELDLEYFHLFNCSSWDHIGLVQYDGMSSSVWVYYSVYSLTH